MFASPSKQPGLDHRARRDDAHYLAREDSLGRVGPQPARRSRRDSPSPPTAQGKSPPRDTECPQAARAPLCLPASTSGRCRAPARWSRRLHRRSRRSRPSRKKSMVFGYSRLISRYCCRMGVTSSGMALFYGQESKRARGRDYNEPEFHRVPQGILVGRLGHAGLLAQYTITSLRGFYVQTGSTPARAEHLES